MVSELRDSAFETDVLEVLLQASNILGWGSSIYQMDNR
jgi:hypothetical protein